MLIRLLEPIEINKNKAIRNYIGKLIDISIRTYLETSIILCLEILYDGKIIYLASGNYYDIGSYKKNHHQNSIYQCWKLCTKNHKLIFNTDYVMTREYHDYSLEKEDITILSYWIDPIKC